ncbi:MAG: hypothetical protein KGO49_15070 [Gammaproteobacteria bacterium]|nr:hypothetical protein [Gammaproteobacteria bacterium]
MLTRQEYVTEMSSTLSTSKDKVLTTKVKTKKPRAHVASMTQFGSKRSSRNLFKRIMVISTEILALTLMIASTSYADVVRWYRYYDSRGIPTISSTVSEQHLQQGYDVLDSRMQLIRHYPPFSADKYAQQQVLREQAIAKKISDRHLQETYVSSTRAATQRDREISNIDEQIQRSGIESKHLSDSLNANIASAANFDRENKPIPAALKAQLNKNKVLLSQSNANIAALKAKRDQTNKQFDDAIAQLKVIEAQGNKPDASPTP